MIIVPVKMRKDGMLSLVSLIHSMAVMLSLLSEHLDQAFSFSSLIKFVRSSIQSDRAMPKRKLDSSKFHVSSGSIPWFSIVIKNWSKWRLNTFGFSAFLRTVARGLRLIFWNSGWRCIQRLTHTWLMGGEGFDSSAFCISSLIAADLMMFRRGLSSKLINLRIYMTKARSWSEVNLLSCSPRTSDLGGLPGSRKRSRCNDTSIHAPLLLFLLGDFFVDDQ